MNLVVFVFLNFNPIMNHSSLFAERAILLASYIYFFVSFLRELKFDHLKLTLVASMASLSKGMSLILLTMVSETFGMPIMISCSLNVMLVA